MRHMDEGLLQAWLDGPRAGLTAGERAAVEEHVARCPECSARLEALRTSGDRVGALLAAAAEAEREIPAFDAVVARARELESEAGPPGRSRPRWRGAVGWAASVAVALGAGWLANEWSRPVPEAVLAPVRVTGAPSSVEAADTADPSAEGARDAEGGTPVVAEAGAEAGGLAASAEPERIAAAAPALDSSSPAGAREIVAAGSAEDFATPDPTSPDSGLLGSVPALRTSAPALLTPVPPPPRDPATRIVDAPAPGAGPTAGRAWVRGRVVDAATGQALEAAQVFVPGTTMASLTNADGYFQLFLSPSVDSTDGELALRVELIGYGVEERRVAVDRTNQVLDDLPMSQTALSLDAVVVTGSPPGSGEPREVAAAEQRLPGEPVRVLVAEGISWRLVSRAEAEEVVGFPLPAAPGLDVVAIQVATLGSTPAVRVAQELDGGGTLVLLAARGTVEFPEAPGQAVAEVALDGGVRVSGRADLPPDSLRSLLERIR